MRSPPNIKKIPGIFLKVITPAGDRQFFRPGSLDASGYAFFCERFFLPDGYFISRFNQHYLISQ
jgi:hypothetical protein